MMKKAPIKIEQFMQGELTQGELTKKLRIDVLGLNQMHLQHCSRSLVKRFVMGTMTMTMAITV